MVEYYIRRLNNLKFEVAKFEERKEPAAVYSVRYSELSNTGRCNCPASFRKAFRRNAGTGSADKHVRMVADWLKSGQPIPEVFKYLPEVFKHGCDKKSRY